MTRPQITVLNYGAGNVTSLLNALDYLGYAWKIVKSVEDIHSAEVLIFPGVGAFDLAVNSLKDLGYFDALREYILNDRPFFGICVGMQVLFLDSEERPGVRGLGILPGHCRKFVSGKKPVPHIGWSAVSSYESRFYFVHSYAVPVSDEVSPALVTRYHDEVFVSAIKYKSNVYATQFHPEKSGESGLRLIKDFLENRLDWNTLDLDEITRVSTSLPEYPTTRVIACMDVCEDEQGELIVTKGDSYNIITSDKRIKNHGSPAEFAKIYYEEKADELVFLNITGHLKTLLEDAPMLRLLKETSRNVFIPLTVGGGIRSYKTSVNGQAVHYSALQVADEYFKAGADKISIGSDAVLAAEKLINGDGTELSSIEMISQKYGKQAVVVSIDPIKVWVHDSSQTSHDVRKTAKKGPGGEEYAWYQCTIHGGKTRRDLDVIQLVRACEQLGAGEFLVNSIDRDGKAQGYDLELLRWVKDVSTVPVIASSGAGSIKHFKDAAQMQIGACLAAGIFHRREVKIEDIKEALKYQ